MSEPKLFMVMLGGRAPGCNTELHDVVFAAGTRIQDLYPQLLDAWFGQPQGLHVDAWSVVDQVPGYRVHLSAQRGPRSPRLYFVNIGGYQPDELAERHAYACLAGRNKTEVKQQARAELLKGMEEVHKDDLFDVDDCLTIDSVGPWHVELEPDPAATAPEVVNGYHPIPARAIKSWMLSADNNRETPDS